MAVESAAQLKKNVPFDVENLKIDCDEAHVTGRDRPVVADRALALIDGAHDRDPIAADHELIALVALACYDAGRDTSGQHHFANAARLARRLIDECAVPLEQASGYHLLGVSLPTAHVADRLAALRRRWRSSTSKHRPPPTPCCSRCASSALAEQLSGGSSADRQQARALFEQGLAIRKENQLGDLPGQARTYGGLGRLAFFADPPDYETAPRISRTT